MRQDFSQPQRQSAAGIAIMFAYNFQHSIRVMVIPIALSLIRSKSLNYWYLLIALLAFVVALAIYSYLSYLKFTFFLDEEKQEFVINRGILSRQNLTIRLDKIQQVNINQSLIQRLIGVYSLDIDTAGSDKKEASIKAVDHLRATILREKLLNRSQAAGAVELAEESKAAPMLKLSASTLLKVGLTSNYGASMALLSGFIFAMIETLRSYVEAFRIKENPVEALIGKGMSFFSICVLIGMALLIVLGTNIIRNFLKYYNFEIIRRPDSLAINAGLFTKHNTLLKPNKVQISTFSQNYFQKKFRFINMKIKQASYTTADETDKDHKSTDIDIPGCNDFERDEILKMIFEQLPVKGTVFLPNHRFIFLSTMLNIVIPVLIFIAAGLWAYRPIHQYFFLIIPYVLIAGTMLYFEFIHHRLYISEGHIIKKSGIWDVEHQILEPHKIQCLTAKQYFWHKKADIGHLILHTAAGAIYFKYGNYSDIHRMLNYWLFKLESGKKDWM